MILTCLMLAQSVYARDFQVSRTLPGTDPDYTWAQIKLITCDKLYESVPDAAQKIASKLPLVVLSPSMPGYCGLYFTVSNVIMVPEKVNEKICVSRRETLAHELLHMLGLEHPANEDYLLTHFDDVHVMLKACLGSDYHKRTKFVGEFGPSPFEPRGLFKR